MGGMTRGKETEVGKAPAEKREGALQEVLAHARGEVRRELEEALQKQKTTGRPLLDILRQDVDKEMLKRLWNFLRRPKVRQAMVDTGVIADDELQRLAEAEQSGEAYDPRLGEVLVRHGVISAEQLRAALEEQKQSGRSYWRILLDQGVVTPKQLADAQRYGVFEPAKMLDEQLIANALVRAGLVDRKRLEEMLANWSSGGVGLLQFLADRNVAPRDELGRAVARELGVEYVDLRQFTPQPEALNLLSEELARQGKMIPIARDGTTVTLAMANPQDLAAREQFRLMVNLDVKPVLAFERDILALLDAYAKTKARGGAAPVASMAATYPERPTATTARRPGVADEALTSMAQSASIVDLVASIIEGAIHSHATDIHIEPQAKELRVRYRIDGVLYDVMNLPVSLIAGVISRVKVLASLDITERRHPQDGHFTITVQGRQYDLRVATLPTILGEKLVLRLLNPEDVLKGLRQLGLEPDQLQKVERAVNAPYGMVLATGPIGSGKTTTLYAALSQIDVLTKNVVTIEDPVEYQLPGINQVQVDLRQERTFASMLRSVLRQDANTLMVGEIRDEDTAEVAVRAAMTGHLVFSTLHTNDAVGAVTTLRHFKIPPFLITSSLICVIAQRLVRRVCPDCRQPYKPSRVLARQLRLSPAVAAKTTLYHPAGCSKCYHTGYRGRTGIFEVFEVTPRAKEAILAEASHDRLRRVALAEGMMPLWDAGMKKVLSGETTAEELMRVTRA